MIKTHTTTEKRQRRKKKECAINKTTTDDCRRVTEALRKANNRLQCFPVYMISIWFWITALCLAPEPCNTMDYL